jgi:hypothetical protein
MYTEKGDSGYPDRNARQFGATDEEPTDEAPPKPKQPKDDERKPHPAPRETKLQKDVRIGYESGKFTCGESKHYKSGKDPKNPRFSCAVPLAPSAIIELMEPFKMAKCSCERDAVKAAWSWRKPGCSNIQWVSPNAYFKGICIPGQKFDPTAPPMRVMPVDYRLKPEAVKVLHERFPGWIFTSVGSGDHDHPIAHTTNLVNAYQVTSQFRRNKCYLDLHGNPSSNEQLNRSDNLNIKTVVSLESAKDYLRMKQKWGPERDGDRLRYINCALRDLGRDHAEMVESVDEVVSFHTLYYYEKREIARLLSQTKGGIMTALVHRFKGEEGALNGKEQSWRKERVGTRARIIQTNVETGEQYSHRDMEDWFDGTGFWSPYGQDIIEKTEATQSALESLSWTVNKASDDVFRITIAVVPNSVARLVSDVQETALTELEATNVVKVTVSGVTDVYSIRPELQEVYEEMRGRVVMAPRTADKLSAHAQMTHIKCKQLKDKTGIKIHASEEMDIAMSSFWVDFEYQCSRTPALLSKSACMAAAQAKIMSGKGISSPSGAVKKGLLMMADSLSSASSKATFATLFRSLADEL